MNNEKDSFHPLSGGLSIGTADGWALVGHGCLTIDASTKTDITAVMSFKFKPPKMITIQEIQDLAVDEVAALVGDFDHSYQFSASTRADFANRHICDAASSTREVEFDELVFIDLEVIRPDSLPFKTVLPLMYSYHNGFRFMFGEDEDSDTPLSPEAFWYFMFGCALNYCEAENA